MKKKSIYIYFLSYQSFFTDLSIELANTNFDFEISGLATSPNSAFRKFDYKQLSFLTDLNYKSKLADINYLLYIEKEYGIKISEILHLERYSSKLTNDEKLYYVECFIKKIESDYSLLNFNIILSGGLCDGISFFLYHFSLKKRIKFIYHLPSRLGSDYYFSDHPHSGPINFTENYHSFIKLFDKNRDYFKDVFLKLNDYLLSKKQPDYVSDKKYLFKHFEFDDIHVMIKLLFSKSSFIGESNFFKLLLSRYNKIKQKYIHDSLVSKDIEIGKLNYFVYPLQFHPESATLLLGKWFHNQLEIIKMISRVLPQNVYLVIKEHPISLGRRPNGFYKEATAFHNVKLIKNNEDIYNLISNSNGVITISSTMGLEAILLNKPVILFGDTHYGILSQVIKVENYKKIDKYIEEAINFKKYNEAEYFSFFKSIMNETFYMPNFSPHNYNKGHIVSYLNHFSTELNKIKN
jgi:CDP-glycerol glycerophosphotransferase (TagB/SpsB family)